MNPSGLLPLTATVTQVEQTGPPDAFGDPTEVTTTATFKCWIWRGGAQSAITESTANQNLQSDEYLIALEPAAEGEIDGTDRVTVNGITYEVDGPLWPALNPRTNQVSHIEGVLRRTT